MKRTLKNILLTLLFACATSCAALAAESEHVFFEATNTSLDTVEVGGAGRVISTNILDDGTLEDTLTPGFIITTNRRLPQTVYLTASINTSTGRVNALYSPGGSTTQHAIILSNYDAPPTQGAVNNIKGTPTAADNPNVIAYLTQGLTSTPTVNSEYDNTNNRWLVFIPRQGEYTVQYIIPNLTAPVSSTFSIQDEPGRYEALVTMSFLQD